MRKIQSLKEFDSFEMGSLNEILGGTDYVTMLVTNCNNESEDVERDTEHCNDQ